MTIGEAIATLRHGQQTLDPRSCQDHADLHEAIDLLLGERSRLLEQLKEQTMSFCVHCGRLFPKGKRGVAEFREHIAECNAHPLHPLARVAAAAKVALKTCHESMKPLVSEGVRSPAFSSGADQFAAAWRDLRQAVESVERGE